MRILHTADWHLGDRLGRIDRTMDLRKGVERIGDYCRTEEVDVLLVAGDLFSELARPDGLRDTIEHWQSVFGGFMQRGGTILTLTGNHDNETFCRTLTHAMTLAAPTPTEVGGIIAPGRFYLATEASLFHFTCPRDGVEAQFVLMPFPTPACYFHGNNFPKYSTPEEKNGRLMTAFLDELRRMVQHERHDRRLPTILGAHVHVRGAEIGPSLFRMSLNDDVIIDDRELSDDFAYVALGHIHKPQCLRNRQHVRYSGSIEKMDLGEANDVKGAVIVDIGPQGRVGEPRVVPLESTPIYEVTIASPAQDLERLRKQYPQGSNDLVNLHITYTAGVDSLEQVLQDLEKVFPRWYARDWQETSALGPSAALQGPELENRGQSFQETVRDYVRKELMSHSDHEREEIIARLEELFREDDR
jgi:exonuclease SbcD